MRNLTAALVVAIALMGGFYTGFRYEKGRAAASAPAGLGTAAGLPAARAAASPSPGAAGSAAGGFGGRGTVGQVVSFKDGILTVKDAQGGEVKVSVDGSTTVSRSVAGGVGDLTPGARVTIAGPRGADGTVTATAITVLAAGASRPGG